MSKAVVPEFRRNYWLLSSRKPVQTKEKENC